MKKLQGRGGVTVPTTATTFVAPDVEGVDVMSTPTEPHVGLTFDSINAAKKLLQLICKIQER
jgi:hypothetical protein